MEWKKASSVTLIKAVVKATSRAGSGVREIAGPD